MDSGHILNFKYPGRNTPMHDNYKLAMLHDEVRLIWQLGAVWQMVAFMFKKNQNHDGLIVLFIFAPYFSNVKNSAL